MFETFSAFCTRRTTEKETNLRRRQEKCFLHFLVNERVRAETFCRLQLVLRNNFNEGWLEIFIDKQ